MSNAKNSTKRTAPKILTSRLLNAHLRKTTPAWKRGSNSQSDLASEVAAILANPSTPQDVRELLIKSMRLWSRLTGLDVASPELARDAFMLMNHATPVHQEKKSEAEYRICMARLAVVEIAIAVNFADREGRAPTIPEEAIERYSEARGELEEEAEEMPAVHPPTITAPVDLNLWRQSHPRTIKQCAVRVE
jgi:hypothetical protein